MKGIAVTLLLLLLLAASGFGQVPDDKLIVPGQRIGKWTLDMTVAYLQELNGSKPMTVAALGGPYSGSWITALVWLYAITAWTRDGVYVLALETDFFEKDNPVYETEKNIQVGVSRPAVIVAYGNPIVVADREGSFLIYDEIGLGFKLTRNQSVQSVFVFRPRTAKLVWAF